MRRRLRACNIPGRRRRLPNVTGPLGELTASALIAGRIFASLTAETMRGAKTFIPMSAFLKIIAGLAAALGGCAFAQGASAQTGGAPMSRVPATRPVVVETFLSQSCSKSPPAAETLRGLALRPDVVVLTWHVDYWDALPAPGVGPWKDPFARPQFSARQISYNQRIRGRAIKMTPQTVIDGVISVPGSERAALEKRILEAQFFDELSRPTPPSLEISPAGDGLLRIRINNVGTAYEAVVVSFRREAVTKISGGDNAGATFREANVVSAVAPIASGRQGPGDFTFAAPGKCLDCAVLVQERGNGRIVAARYCSDRSAK